MQIFARICHEAPIASGKVRTTSLRTIEAEGETYEDNKLVFNHSTRLFCTKFRLPSLHALIIIYKWKSFTKTIM